MSVMIGVRIGKVEKKLLQESAAIKGMTLSGFLRDAARTEAHRVLGPPKALRDSGELTQETK